MTIQNQYMLNKIKTIYLNEGLSGFFNLRRVCGLIRLHKLYEFVIFKGLSDQQVFSKIYKTNHWGSKESVSGAGSTKNITKPILTGLHQVLTTYDINSLLDIPCGDFNWMRGLRLDNRQYIGADIVAELIEKNKIYTKDNIKFMCLDITSDSLPKVDLVFTRDCFVHLKLKDIKQALNNIVASNPSSYLMMTNFSSERKNSDIPVTGIWRKLNFQAEPFNFPTPLMSIFENNSKDSQQQLALWKISDIAPIITKW